MDRSTAREVATSDFHGKLFSNCTLCCCLNVLSKYGISGYIENWDDYGYKFPIVELLSLLGAKTEKETSVIEEQTQNLCQMYTVT